MKLRLFRVFLFVLAFVALAYAWGVYESCPILNRWFRRDFFDARPIYAMMQTIDLSEREVASRFFVAIAICLVGVGLSVVAALRRWRAWICMLIAIPACIAINASVAQIRMGHYSLVKPFLRTELEYYGDIDRVNDAPALFISSYAALSPTLALHPGTHPPGGVLFLWLGSKLFGSGVDAAVWWSISFGSLGVLCTYWLAVQVIGSARARRAIPLALLAPNLVLFGATSMDIVFFAFGSAALAAMFWAMKRLSVTRVLVAGALFWMAAFMTFAVVTLPIVAGTFALVSIATHRRRGLKMLGRLALVGLAFVFFQSLAQLLLGYDLFQVKDAAMQRDFDGVRMTGYESLDLWWTVSLANLGAFVFGSGVALSAAVIAGALAIPLDRARLRLPANRLALSLPIALVLLSGSTLFTFETERVWLSAVPALICVTAGIRGWMIWWLALPLLMLQTFLTECTLYTYW